MRGALLLSARYLGYHRLRTLILVICVSIALFLPLAVQVLVARCNRLMIDRSESTPLVLGAKGSPNDLVLNTLYFRGRLDDRLSMSDVRVVAESNLARPIPIYVRYTAGDLPIVGTSLDYFDFRRLRVARGRLPQVLGEVVLGAAAAARLDLTVGHGVLSDFEKLYDLSAAYPLRMRVVGILEESHSADDRAVFTDVKTTWVIEGIGHGHQDARDVNDPSLVLASDRAALVMSAAVVEYNEITPENLETFHFHGNHDAYPVSAIIAVPRDAKSATIFKARYRAHPDVQVVVPRRIVGEMMDVVFRVKRYLNTIFGMVLLATALFLILVLLLTAKIRQREFATLWRMGSSRWTVLTIQAGETLLILLVSTAVAALLLSGLIWYVTHFDLLP